MNDSRGFRPIATSASMVAALAVVLLTCAAAPAQDVTNISPDTHTVVLENSQVRVLAVRIKPGETVGMHSHPPNVVYYLGDGRIRLTLPDGKREDREIRADTAVWSEATQHAAENVGSTDVREVQVELKGTGGHVER